MRAYYRPAYQTGISYRTSEIFREYRLLKEIAKYN